MSLIARGGQLLLGYDGKLTTSENCCCDPCDLAESTLSLIDCECFDFDAQTVRNRVGLNFTFLGSALGSVHPGFGGAGPIDIPAVSVSGTYFFPTAGFACSIVVGSLYVLDQTFLGNVAGFDAYAVLAIQGQFDATAAVVSAPGFVPTGSPPPTFINNSNIDALLASAGFSKPCPEILNKFCPTVVSVSNQLNQLSGSIHHDVSGVQGISVQIVY